MDLLSTEPVIYSYNKTLKSFWKVSGRCNVKKIVREIIFRNDISCGIDTCISCNKSSPCSLTQAKPILILTADVIMKQISTCEKWLRNCVVPVTVAQEVKRRSAYIYGRLRLLLSSNHGESGYYLFSNENFKDTFIEQTMYETVAERDERAVVKCAIWYTRHTEARVVLLRNNKLPLKTGDLELSDEFIELTIYEYAKTYDNSEIFESLAPLRVQDTEFDLDESGVKKDVYYPRHLTDEEMSRGKEEGIYFYGTLHMYIGSYKRGYVSCGNKIEFKVDGLYNLNRAIDGDYVCVELISDDDISIDNTKNDLKTTSIVSNDINSNSHSYNSVSNGLTSDLNVVNDVVPSVGIESLETTLLDQHMEPEQYEIVRKSCRVVGILRRNWREYCGTLLPLDDKSDTNSSIDRTFIPVDVRIPFIIIETKRNKELENKRITVVIDGWDRCSKRPSGHWTSIIGDVDDRDVESIVTLKEHQVILDDFKLESYKELPNEGWVIPEYELNKRWDFRNDLIFSIDPPGCKDIDDALGVKVLPNGNYQFSVHIADVSYFVKPNSSLDIEASIRCTTVYLVDRRTDMLPSLLTTNLCSLIPNQDRLAFSVVWEITKDGTIIDTKFTKSIIRSCKAFTYKEANDLIDVNANDEITNSLKILNSMAKKFREMRFNRGAVELESSDVKFEFDSTKVTNVEGYKIYETNKMIEEFMLLANISVAVKIYENYPKNSLLRHHPAPIDEKLNELKRILASQSITYFNFGTSKELNNSIQQIQSNTNPNFTSTIRILTTRCMSKALYCNSSDLKDDEFKHYGLCTDLYTHFTSPIRRYADIIVHRLLSASLGIEPLDNRILNTLTSQCDELNYKHQNAQWCGRTSNKMFAYLYFKEHGPQESDSTVLDIMENRVVVLSHKYGIEAVATVEYINYCKKTRAITLVNGTIIKVFDKLRIKIYSDNKFYRSSIIAEILN